MVKIKNIFFIFKTEHQRRRYALLKYVVINNFNRVETLEEYENFIQTNYVFFYHLKIKNIFFIFTIYF